MASFKEIQHNARPLTHRLSISSSSPSNGLTPRQTHARTNSHSAAPSALNAQHRVSRRKSVTNNTANTAAIVAAMKEAGDPAAAVPIAAGRRNTMSKSGMSRAGLLGSLPSPPASLPTHRFGLIDGKPEMQGSAIDDDSNDASDGDDSLHEARLRRASDGQPLVKEGRKSNRPELRCEKCGKGYKHSSCLTKHLWEHTPEWSLTSKLLISKHQQVQLLEAASVLVTLNNVAEDATTPPDSAKDFASERDSASPGASGYSDQHDGRSSADTTPPPQFDGYSISQSRHSDARDISRSYQSAPSAESGTQGTPSAQDAWHVRQPSQERRPSSSGHNTTGQDDRDLAAAVELLSCSFNSNSVRTVHLPEDAPPVPPLPAQYLDQASFSGTSFINSFPSRAQESFTRGELRREDTKMSESGDEPMDDDDDMQSRARSDEDEDGVFGRMEE